MQIKYILAVLLPAIALIAITPSVFANGNAAIHISPNSECAFIDPLQLPAIVPTGTGIATGVVTSSGNEQTTCKGTVPGYNGPPVHLDYANTGFACDVGVPPFETTNWHEEISPNGKAILVCTANPGSTAPSP